MKCQKCNQELPNTAAKIGFRARCPHCEADLHTCTHCRYYAPGKPNDCMVPGTDYVRDRDAANLCEEFKIKTNEHPKNDSSKKKFNSLFKDDDS